MNAIHIISIVTCIAGVGFSAANRNWSAAIWAFIATLNAIRAAL